MQQHAFDVLAAHAAFQRLSDSGPGQRNPWGRLAEQCQRALSGDDGSTAYMTIPF
jgi:hypothetical protein